jgi:putative flippase GtrA
MNGTPASDSQKKPLFEKKERFWIALTILILSLVSGFFCFLYKTPEESGLAQFRFDAANDPILYDPVMMGYSLGISAVSGTVLTLISLLCPVRSEKPSLNSVRFWIYYAILFLLGMVAHAVLCVAFALLHSPVYLNFFLSTFIYLVYLYLMIRLYFYGDVNSKAIFFEVVRFALVGILASLVDIAVETLVNKILPESWNSLVRIILYVTAGFLVGVVVNYLCSVYMVYKATTDKDISRTVKGKILFLVLSAVGLAMSWGLRYLFQDVFHIGFVTSFILQTLIVMIWNYLSRKYIIFK